MLTTRTMALACALLALPAVARTAPAEVSGPPRIAVSDLEANGVPPTWAEAASTRVAGELGRMGVFRVIAREDVKSILDFDRQRAVLGCDEPSCMTDLGKVLGVDYLVRGRISKVGDVVSVELSRIRLATASVDARAKAEASSEADGFLRAAEIASRKVVRDLLSQHSGTLVLDVSEDGADILLDGEALASSPAGALTVPGGPHELQVQKGNFAIWKREVRIAPQETASERVLLVPTAEFLDRYESRARTYRWLAWSGAGLAAAATGIAIWARVRADDVYDQHEAVARQYYDVDPATEAPRTFDLGAGESEHLTTLKDDTESLDTLSVVSTITAALAGGAATYFFVSGEDPARYAALRRLREKTLKPPAPPGAPADPAAPAAPAAPPPTTAAAPVP